MHEFVYIYIYCAYIVYTVYLKNIHCICVYVYIRCIYIHLTKVLPSNPALHAVSDNHLRPQDDNHYTHDIQDYNHTGYTRYITLQWL